jgi:hypothetical protein
MGSDELVGCAGEGTGVYTPYLSGSSPTGSVSQYPWRGGSGSYPSGTEDFRGYSSMPAEVECSDDKGHRDYMDVTDGCLNAVSLSGGTYTRGQIEADPSGYFRALALGRTSGSSAPTKWTDQAVSYRFYYHAKTGNVSGPGFKIFARYRTEYDLYVASWRDDGVAQIQKKQCGNYTALAVDKNYGKPSADTWHTIKFVAKGSTLSLYLDGDLAVQANDTSFSWGTGGMRIDSYDGAYIDDWKIAQP